MPLWASRQRHLRTRLTDAAAFNSPNVVYVFNGFYIGEEAHEGWKAAAVIAGLLAYLPASDSATHKVVPSATKIIGALTNAKIEECLKSGALIFTVSSSGAVWIEQGVNTLTVLASNQDAGLEEDSPHQTRYELITRINSSTEGIIGSVNNDSNGRATFVAIANGVINSMVAEGKLLAGVVYEDPANPAKGDSAWFIIDVYDLDSIEKVYITYKFHFSED